MEMDHLVSPPPGTLYVSAGPIASGALAGVSLRTALDSRGLRLLQVDLQGSLSINSMISQMGVPSSAMVDVDGVMTLSSPRVLFVRNVVGAPGEILQRLWGVHVCMKIKAVWMGSGAPN